jgi:transcriptional regulator with XRE-family HTH domain
MTLFEERRSGRESGHVLWASQVGKNELAHAYLAPCTIKDVARLAGVSIATVSRVTSGSGKVSGKTKTKVLEAASALKYFPNAYAAELARVKDGRPRRSRNRASSLPGAKFNMIILVASEERCAPSQ